jgi:hypothetical protein
MGALRTISLKAGLFLLLLAAPSAALAQGEQMGLTTYYFTDSGSNTVATMAFNLAKKVLTRTVLLIDIELDHVTIPPVTAVTGATRPQRRKNETFEKNRGQVIVGVEQGIGSAARMAGNFYWSRELDYTSTGLIGTFSQDLFANNTTVTLRGQYNNDYVGRITLSGDLVSRRKQIYNGGLYLSQVLSPTTVVDLMYDGMYMEGLMRDPYRQVSVYASDGSSSQTYEKHPADRLRHSGTARISQAIPAITASLLGSYRYYRDTWDVQSHMAEMKFNKYILRDLVFGLSYRYYLQSQSYFTQEVYAGNQFLGPAFRTSDYKLQKFSSNNVGLTLTYLLRGLGGTHAGYGFLEGAAIEILYFHYFNDLDFTADIVQGTIQFSL